MTGKKVFWQSPGPVCEAFMDCMDPIQAIMGPIGSGKTSAVLMKMIFLAQKQQRSTRDGCRKFKFCVVRDTYRQLWKTTIPSWFNWMSKDTGSWVGGADGPATHVINYRLPDGSMVELTAEFVAIGDNKVEDVLRGYEVTCFYLNEADLLAHEVFIYARSRAGRYPKMDEGGPSWYGILCDFNAPDTENWIYDVFVEKRLGAFFHQPSGFSAKAENLANLPRGYYDNISKDQPEWWVRRMIRNEFGYSRDGLPVHQEFNDALHVAAEDFDPISGLPIILGIDAGLSPAGAFNQRLPDGQWRCFDELVTEQGTGPSRFSDLLNAQLTDRYAGFPVVGYVDPSAAYGGDKQSDDDQAWLDIVAKKTGLRLRAAPSNDLTPRREALTLPFTRLIDGRIPGFLMAPRCITLRKGFNSMFRYKKIRVPGQERFTTEVDKNHWSHVCEAEEYGVLGGGEYAAVMGRQDDRASPVLTQTAAITEDNPTGSFAGGSFDILKQTRSLTDG